MDAQGRARSGEGKVRSPVTLDDLVADLIWPRLLRSGALALHPGRLGIAFFLLIGVGLVVMVLAQIEIWLGFSGGPTEQADFSMRWTQLLPANWPVHPAGAAGRLIDAFTALPLAAILAHPLVASLGTLAAVLLWSIAGGAICRGAAMELATGEGITWPQALGFAAARWRSFAGAMIGPVLLVWGVALVLAIGGLVLLRLPGLNLIGALLYGLFLLGGLVAALVMVAYLLGHWMLVPAVACEGTDAIDAVQRAYAYVFGRPARLVAYLATLAAQAIVVGWVVWMLSSAIVGFTVRTGGAWAGDNGRIMLEQGTVGAVGGDAGAVMAGAHPEATTLDRSRTSAWGEFLVKMWTLVPVLLVWSFLVSFAFCGSTQLYLAMRRVVDGQEMTELWMPPRAKEEVAPLPEPSRSGASKDHAPDEIPDVE
jgi:hypothetical protein